MGDSNRRFLFLDLDGVICDNAMWESESSRLAGARLSELLGGDADIWAEHQDRIWLKVWNRGSKEYRETPGLRRLNLSRWWDRLHAEWVRQLCDEVGVKAPGTFEERVDVAERAFTHVYLNTNAVFPGSAEAIRSLAVDFEIHTASGNPSWVIETVLARMGVRERIGTPFGSDLVGFQKGHSAFHARILREVGARPDASVVVDDNELPLLAARKLGAKTVRIGGSGSDQFDLTIGSLSELPDAIRKVI